MDTTEYHQNLIEMSFRIIDLNHGLFSTKVRLSHYKKKDPENLMEKLELSPLLETLKDENNAYNANTEKQYSNLEDITLEKYETFETIIKKIDENEKIDTDMILEQNIAIDEINQYFTDINTAGDILLNWQKIISNQRDPYEAHLEKARKGC